VTLSQWTTLGVGGPAGLFVEVGDLSELAAVLAEADAAHNPVLVLGGGSNIVISDNGFPGTVVRVGLMGVVLELDGETVRARVGAGEDWSSFVARCVAEGLSGVECLSGIPGLVGGTPVQNVGAYGQDVAGSIIAVEVWDRRRRCSRRFSPGECAFGYRASLFKRTSRYVVTEVHFRLQRTCRSGPLGYPELARRLGRPLGQAAPLDLTAAAVLALRREKGMVLDSGDPDTRSAGSFFTNPVLGGEQFGDLQRRAPGVPAFPGPEGVKVPAAWLVERAGFAKGYANRGAAISSKHALALTVRPGGTASDLLALAREVRGGVRQVFGVSLKPEPTLVGARI
jgi:UDP-N-acetylmuramate dehydrogenase